MTFDERFKGAQDVFAIQRRNGKPYFFINGYISIPLDNPEEKIVGSISSMYSPRTDRALVLGLGSGATAGTVGLLFEHTDVVEINKVVIDHQHLMRKYSFDIAGQPGVDIVHDDGVHFIKVSPERYSLILNTVTSPLYFSSSKLYTLDFFEMVKRRLAPDGVYVTWVDYRLGDRGLDTILESLEQAFENCSFSYLTPSYYMLTCSNEPLEFNNYEHVVSNERLREFFADHYQLSPGMFPYAVLVPDAFRLRSPESIPLNTLDYPALEFEMARLRRQAIPGFGKRLSQVLDLDELRSELGTEFEWDPWEFAFFAERRLASKEPLTRLIVGKVEDLDGSFDEVALRAAETVGSADAYYRNGRFLLRYDRYEAAITLLSRALELDSEKDNAHFHLARAYGGAGRFDLAFTHCMAEWELDRDNEVPMLAARVLIGDGRYEEALGWLDAAQLLKYRSRPMDVFYFRGVAYEGLGDPVEARNQYLTALRFDENHGPALDALRKLESE
jgi:tetratricopeptide (TPR) repeat protein